MKKSAALLLLSILALGSLFAEAKATEASKEPCTQAMQGKVVFNGHPVKFEKILNCDEYKTYRYQSSGLFGLHFNGSKEERPVPKDYRARRMCIGVTPHAVYFAGETEVTYWSRHEDQGKENSGYKEVIQGTEGFNQTGDRDSRLTSCGGLNYCQRYSTANTNKLEIDDDEFLVEKRSYRYCGYTLPGYGIDKDYALIHRDKLKLHENGFGMLTRTQEDVNIEIDVSNTYDSWINQQDYLCEVERGSSR